MLNVVQVLLTIIHIVTCAMTLISFVRGEYTIGVMLGVADIILSVLKEFIKNRERYVENINKMSKNELHSKQMNYFIIISVSYIVLIFINYILLGSGVIFSAMGVWVIPICYSYLSLFTKRYDSRYLFIYGNIMFFLCNLPPFILFIGCWSYNSGFKDKLLLILGILFLDAPIFFVSQSNNEKLHDYN